MKDGTVPSDAGDEGTDMSLYGRNKSCCYHLNNWCYHTLILRLYRYWVGYRCAATVNAGQVWDALRQLGQYSCGCSRKETLADHESQRCVKDGIRDSTRFRIQGWVLRSTDATRGVPILRYNSIYLLLAVSVLICWEIQSWKHHWKVTVYGFVYGQVLKLGSALSVA